MAQFTPVPPGGYLVGGAVRDLLLGRAVQDLDWVVAEPERAAREAAAALGGSAFPLDEARGHWRVVASGKTRDYAPLRGALRDDLSRRDFTANAVAVTSEGVLLDPLGGLADVRAKRLRLAGPSALADDPLRALRGVRFATALGFALEPEALEAVRDCFQQQRAGRWPIPAPERVLGELDALLRSSGAARGLSAAHDLGALFVYLPELSACDGVTQGGFHHLDVLEHSLLALDKLTAGFPEADLALRWATLLHDIGKPQTKTYDEAGAFYHFYGHAELGAELSGALLRRLRAPERLNARVAALVRYHMLPLPRTEREARRFVHRRRDLLPDLLKLMVADREAARGPRSSEASRQAYRLGVARILKLLEAPPPLEPLLTGRDIMGLLGLSEGPQVGAAVRFLAEAEAVGDVRSRDEAEAALKRYAARQGWGADPDCSP